MPCLHLCVDVCVCVCVRVRVRVCGAQQCAHFCSDASRWIKAHPGATLLAASALGLGVAVLCSSMGCVHGVRLDVL